MKYFKNFLLILLSSIILKPAMSYAALNTDYFCEIIVSEQNFNSPLIDNFPKIIELSYVTSTKELIKFNWDDKSVLKYFHSVDFSSKSKVFEIWRKNYGMTLNEEDIKNGIYFEIYSSDLVAHMYKQFISGINYQCYKL